MIEPSLFYQSLYEKGMDFFSGVPDSLLQALCACLSERAGRNYVIAANEGNAVGIAAGHYLATGKPGVVFLQNSGICLQICSILSAPISTSALSRASSASFVRSAGFPGPMPTR